MATVTFDIEDGSAQTVLDEDGYQVQRTAYVEGITPGSNDSVVYDAINDPAMPDIGDAHPTITNISLTKITGRSLSPTKARCTLTYSYASTDSSEATADISTSASTVTQETKIDVDGNLLNTSYGAGSIFVDYEPFTAEVDNPRITYSFEYTSTEYPRAMIDAYTGRVNDGNWNGYAAKTLLCTGISADEIEGGYRVRASFAHDPDTWQFFARVQYLDLPLTDYPAIDPDTALDHSTGIKAFDVLPTADYSALGFIIPGTYCTATGTALDGLLDSDIVTGGKTIILTLTNDTWVTSGATFDAIRQDILDGLTSNKSGANGWDAQSFAVTDVVRTSSTVVTITLSAEASYTIDQTEQISIKIPASALTTSALPLVVSQRFDIKDQSLFQGDGS